MLIIPAIDIIDGKCVRLTKGNYDTKIIYNENPVDAAKAFENAGITHLHLVDLDGAKKSEVVNWKVLESIASQTKLQIDFSGGIKTKQSAQQAFDLGATQITVGSLAAKNPKEFVDWIWEFGEEKLILGADVIKDKIAIHGWQESSTKDIYSYLDYFFEEGIDYVLCTDVSKDGMLQGPSIDLYKDILEEYEEIKLIASGGVSSLEDLNQLKEIGCYAAIVGKAFYEGRISLSELSNFQ
ncbi:MAG TPA: 1-(5-phosphoribosyl)-5-[(5-phosphoribosylamino)methylideneamino]imidazole-4-carboxamide isomerase [Chitinophagales bacterium]|jgi:phosphoribosylformimino-5-aminoimidazole carboxamide ribotide isomerase|nr:1-(5-phosphoribosyl)-5-[(5-phosphoribosylamino)methylideneamino]imidazole-4-carboxamide isomerase [Chitinophagales bacterium]HPH87491.1 1-(5-phosphoribosyl)-5-[(5-phosphoribosylamino)methylideneamino]imidazole-4-carboxamide isomerase [Chitinophagales bacterium]